MKKKKSLIILGGVFVGCMVLLGVFMFSVGAVVKVGINSVLPQITGTPCSIGMCTFNPILGKLTIRNFNIGNPEGYVKENAFELGKMVVDVGLGSLLSDKIVIEEITIDSMSVDFEMKLTKTNLSTIKGNVDEFAKSDTPKEPSKEEEEVAETPSDDSKKSKRIQIDLFQFTNSSVLMGAGGATARVPLANLIIRDIGKESPNGATIGEVSEKIFSGLYKSIMTTVKNQATSIDTDSMKKGATNVLNDVKNLFGGGKK